MQKPVYFLMLIALCIATVNAGEKCGPNEEYYDCIPYRGTCNVPFGRGRLPICNAGCACKKGYKRAAPGSNKCVAVGPDCK